MIMRVASSILSKTYDSALALVYPQSCAVCSRSVESRHDGVVCDACWKATRVFSESDTFCWKCGALSRAQINEERRQSIRCGKCDDEAYTAARACGAYEGALRASILQLKRERHVCRRLAALMQHAQQREPLNRADLIVPVPLHADRERERGFNQAVILGRELSSLSGLPLDEHSVVRLVHTERHRAGMDAKARQRSVAGAFAVRHTDLVAGERVLLVDDVLTTGATVSACAEALKQSGAEEVFVLTIARA
jgi:ComF family protein